MEIPYQAHKLAQMAKRHLSFERNGEVSISETVLLHEGLDMDEINSAYRFLSEYGVIKIIRQCPEHKIINGELDVDTSHYVNIFSVDQSKLDAFFSEALGVKGKVEIIFDEDASTLTIGEFKILLPPSKNEYFFCRAMFKYPVGKFVDWSEIYEEIDGDFDGKNSERAKKQIRDIIRSINNRIKKASDSRAEELFTWKVKTIRRNY